MVLQGEVVLFEQNIANVEETSTSQTPSQLSRIKKIEEATRHSHFEHIMAENGLPYWTQADSKYSKFRGDFFGEICLLGRPHRRLSAMAKEHTILLELN